MTIQSRTSRFPLPGKQFEFAGFSWPRFVAVLPAKGKANRLATAHSMCGPYYHAPVPLDGCNGRGFYMESQGMPGLRWQWADEVEGVRIDHTGWLTDDHGIGEPLRGVVFRLPKGRGFLSGWSMGKDMCASVSYEISDTERAAAYHADQWAEHEAEAMRYWGNMENAS